MIHHPHIPPVCETLASQFPYVFMMFASTSNKKRFVIYPYNTIQLYNNLLCAWVSVSYCFDFVFVKLLAQFINSPHPCYLDGYTYFTFMYTKCKAYLLLIYCLYSRGSICINHAHQFPLIK